MRVFEHQAARWDLQSDAASEQLHPAAAVAVKHLLRKNRRDRNKLSFAVVNFRDTRIPNYQRSARRNGDLHAAAPPPLALSQPGGGA